MYGFWVSGISGTDLYSHLLLVLELPLPYSALACSLIVLYCSLQSQSSAFADNMQISFQFKHPSIGVSGRFHFCAASSNRALHVKSFHCQYLLNHPQHTWHKTKTKKSWSRAFSGVFESRSVSLAQSLFHNTSSFKHAGLLWMPPGITEIRIFWRLGDRWMKFIQVGRVWLALWILRGSCLLN